MATKSSKNHFEALVVGAGIHGLSTAWALHQSGLKSIALLERFQLGHSEGSSHGHSRISRSTYADARYVEMMTWCYTHGWPSFEESFGAKLVYPTKGLFFGSPGGLVETYAQVMREAEAGVEQFSAADIPDEIAPFRLPPDDIVLVDPTAALLDAESTRASLQRSLVKAGISIFQETTVTKILFEETPLRIETLGGAFEAERVIVTAGPWVGELVGQISTQLMPVRQRVGYFSLDQECSKKASELPVWVYLGDHEGDVYYGLPEFGREGIKAAFHNVKGPETPPESPAIEQQPSLEDVEAVLRTRLGLPIGRRVGEEYCFYTCTPDENFLLTPHPQNPHCIVASGFSGHSFKFGPLIGRVLSDLALEGTTDLPYPKVS